MRLVITLVTLPIFLLAHGTPTPTPTGPLHVQQSVMVDATGQLIQLRGVEIPDLNLATATTFGILRLRWNLNAVRLPVSSAAWRRDGQSYLDSTGKIVQAANDAGLVAVLCDNEDSGLPTGNTIEFWKTWAAYFKDAPHVIFGVFNQPSVNLVPGHSSTQRAASDWQFWLRGGTALNGQPVVGMQALVDVIRSTGATQVVAVSSFFDPLDFQGFGPDFFVQDSNVIYEVDPFYDHALTSEDRDRNFGFLARSVPVYAGRWGLDLTGDTPACRDVPVNLQAATDLLFQTFAYFDSKFISWTVSSFESHSLIQDASTFDPTRLDRTWTCGTITDPEPGMGQVQLLWLTGDPGGFGVIAPDQVASAAGGPSAPVAPGEVINFFGFLFGPANNSAAALDNSGNLPTTLDGVRIFFDGEAAPIFSTGPFEITTQVPYSVQGKTSVNVQLFYRDIPSNLIQLSVVDAMPGIVPALATNEALALNQDGSRNSFSNPATPGSIVALYATGYGQTSPPGVTGRPAQAPYAQPALPIFLRINGMLAEVLYAAEAPGFVGLLQINARVPSIQPVGKPVAVPVLMTAGSQPSLPGIALWVD